MTEYLRVIFLQHLFWWGIMTSSLAILLFFFVTTSLADATVKSRGQWKASLAVQMPTRIAGPVSWVVIHHSGADNNCSQRNCSQAVKNIQQYHMEQRKWSDIAYNFLVAPTGDVFEGRGWGTVGSHTPKYNSKSVGICLIGDYQNKSPPEAQLRATQQLISRGVELNKVKPLYKVIGHRQVRPTICPGDQLFQIIQTWPNYDNHSE